MGCNHCNYLSSRRFEPPSRSIFIIFQGEYKGLESKIWYPGAPNPSSRIFTRHALIGQIPPGQWYWRHLYPLTRSTTHTEKTRSTVLIPCRAKEYVVPSTLTRCITTRVLFLELVPGTFFNARNQAKQLQLQYEANPYFSSNSECVGYTQKKINQIRHGYSTYYYCSSYV